MDIPLDIENIVDNTGTTGIRQSRRLAQLKIKEEAERRKLEEIALAAAKSEHQLKKGKKNVDKDYKGEKGKRSKVTSEDDTTKDYEPEDKTKKKKRKRKHKNLRDLFDESNPWKSSSDSSSSNVEEEEDVIDYSEEEEESPLFKSDHEFSPESDLEGEGDVQPMKRARTARKGRVIIEILF